MAAAIWLLAVIMLSASKNLGIQDVSHWLDHQLGGDFGVHVLLAGGLSYLTCRAFPQFSYKPCLGLLSPVVSLLVLCVLLEELSQMYLPNRSFSWLDFAGSYLGIVLGCLLARVFIIKQLAG